MDTLPRLPEHHLEHFCRAELTDPVLGRTCEDILLDIYERNVDATVREVINVALYDLHAVMMTLFQVLEQVEAMSDSPIELVMPPPMRFDA